MTTAVVTGSRSLAGDDRRPGRDGRASTAIALSDHERADAEQRDPDRPRNVAGRRRASPRRRRRTQSKPMKTQPPTASAASIAAPTEPPESASAPRVSPRIETVLLAEDEQQREPDPDRGEDLGGDPGLDRPRRARRSRTRPIAAQTTTRTIPAARSRSGVGVDAEQGQQPRRAEIGDRRVGGGVGADRDPAVEPAVGRRPAGGGSTGRRRRRSGTPRPARRRRASSRHWPASATGSTQIQAGPATAVPTSTTA